MPTGKSLLIAAAAAIVLGGCASRGNVELLEGRLRQQEDRIYGLQRELATAKSELAAAQREVSTLRTQYADLSAGAADVAHAPEQIHSLARVEGVQISRMLSGGLNRDGQPGDDHVTTLIMPVDAQGDLVKAPAAVRIELLDMSQDDPARQLGVWEFTPAEAEKLWRKGLFGSGYAIQVPWQKQPQSSTVTLHARLTTADGRRFDSSQEIKVAPPVLATKPVPELRSDNEPARPPELLKPVSAARPGEPADFAGEAVGVVRLGDGDAEEENPFEQTARRIESPPERRRPRAVEPTSDRWTELSRPTLR